MTHRLLAGALVGWLCLTSPAGPVESAPSAVPQLPVAVPDDQFLPLYRWIDLELQQSLGERLGARPDWRRLVRSNKLAVGIVDLSDPARPRFARVNGNVMMYAASLPKIAILLASYQSFEDGSLEDTPEIRADMAAMIRRSDNAAATAMIDRLGFERIAEVLKDPRYMLYDESRGGGLWVGKRYAKAGRRVGDPLRNISHAATVTQVCRLYYLLATGRVVSLERSREMLADLGDPGLHHKFVGVLEKKAPRARLFRKSGSWRDWHSDSALVWGPQRRYILVAMTESPHGETIMRELVSIVEDLLVASAPST